MFHIKANLAKSKALWESASWDDVANYIGPNAEAYRATFDQHRASWLAKGRGPAFAFSWHWPAFIPLLGIPWAAARKQWLFVGLMVGALVIVNIIAMLYPNGASFGFMWFLVAMIAKPIYVQTAVDKIRKIKAAHPAGADVRAAIADAGGLNMAYGYGAGALCFALIALSVWSLVFDAI